jgi:hypothetical protein
VDVEQLVCHNLSGPYPTGKPENYTLYLRREHDMRAASPVAVMQITAASDVLAIQVFIWMPQLMQSAIRGPGAQLI